MWTFQQDKKRRIAAGEAITEPFLTTGLDRYSRRPNYVGEIGLWWVFHLFAVAATGEWLNWTRPGFIALTLMLVGSIRLAESHSTAKYSGYCAYQARTPVLIPKQIENDSSIYSVRNSLYIPHIEGSNATC